MWTSRQPELGRPDRIVFDLDPPEGGHAGARRAARFVREILAELGLPSRPVATGSIRASQPPGQFDDLLSEPVLLVAVNLLHRRVLLSH